MMAVVVMVMEAAVMAAVLVAVMLAEAKAASTSETSANFCQITQHDKKYT